MNSGPVLAAVLIAINVITLLFITPLNSLILVYPYELVCISCLCTIYGGGILVVGFSLFLANRYGGEKTALRVQKTLSIVALVSFLHLVQITTVSSSWKTLYVIVCVVVLAPAVIGFLRAEKKTVILVHQFLFLLFLYEIFNFGLVILQTRELESNIESAHNRAGQVVLEEDGHHVFWIILDEFSLVQSLQENNFNVHIVPNLEKFSQTSTWYPHARTLYPETATAIPALLLGKKDVTEFNQQFLYNFNSKNHLSSIAQNMEVFIFGYHLPYCLAFQEIVEECRIFHNRGFADSVSLVRHIWKRAIPGMLRNTRTGKKLRLLILGPPANRERPIALALNMGQSFNHPTFTFIHEELPHSPYRFTSNGDVRQIAYDGEPSNSLSHDELEELQEFYREQVTYADSLFGEFIARLKAKKLYDQSWIVVMSDHGISFDPQKPGRDTLGHEQVDRVPFLIKSPGQTRGVVNPRPVDTSGFFEILLVQMERVKRQNKLPPE